MIAINTVAYLSFIASIVTLLLYPNHVVTTTIYTIETLAMTFLLTYSMAKLNKFSKLLSANGILASRGLIKVHLWGFWISSILEIGNFCVALILGV